LVFVKTLHVIIILTLISLIQLPIFSTCISAANTSYSLIVHLMFNFPLLWITSNSYIVFKNKPALLLLIPLSLLMLIIWRRTSRRRQALSNIYGVRLGHKPLFYTILKILAIASLLIAIANPVLVYTKTIEISSPEELVKYSGKLPVHYIVLIDVSPSMYRENRLGEAYKALKAIASSLNKTDYLTIAVFGGEVVKIYSGKASEYNVSGTDLSEYNITYTAISHALGWANAYSKTTGLPSIVVVITDGANNYGGDPVEATMSMNSSGTPVVYVRVGNDPRGYPLFNELRSKGITVVNAHELDAEALYNLLAKALIESKYKALVKTGRSYVEVEEKIGLPTHVLLAIALASLIISRIEGV